MNIVIIDDSETERALIGQVVQSLGHTPVPLENGTDAVDVIRRYQASLVLLDVVMPDADGFKICREIRKSTDVNKVPIVMVTSKKSPTDRMWATRQGANDLLGKPFEPKELAAMINKNIYA